MRTLIALAILTFFFTGCGKGEENPVVSWISAPIRLVLGSPPEAVEDAPESTNELRAVNGRYDGVLLLASVSGIFLCFIQRYKVGMGLIAAGVGGFILLDLLAAFRIWIQIGAVVATLGAIVYFGWHLYTKQTLKGTFKLTEV